MKKITILFYFACIIGISIYCTPIDDIIDGSIRFNKWEEAKKDLEAYLKKNNSDVYAYSLYSVVLKELKLYDEAILALKNSIVHEKSDAKKGEIYFNIGNLFYDKNQKDIALEMYQKSIEFDTMLASPYYMSGLIYFELNNTELTIKNWKRYIGLTTDIEKRKKIEEIIKKIEKDV